MTNNIEHLCMSLFVIHISFMKSLFKNVFCPFLSGVFVLFLTELQKLLIYYKYNFFFLPEIFIVTVLPGMCIANVLFHSVACLFVFLMMSSVEGELSFS